MKSWIWRKWKSELEIEVTVVVWRISSSRFRALSSGSWFTCDFSREIHGFLFFEVRNKPPFFIDFWKIAHSKMSSSYFALTSCMPLHPCSGFSDYEMMPQVAQCNYDIVFLWPFLDEYQTSWCLLTMQCKHGLVWLGGNCLGKSPLKI